MKYWLGAQPLQGAHARSVAPPHACTSKKLSLQTAEQVEHTASVVGPHATDANSVELQVVQAPHAVSAVGVHGAVMNSLEPQAVHAPHTSPVPVKPGLHKHATLPPTSMHSASGLQPPLSTAQAPARSGTHVACMHAASGAHR
jgi:hypothetical protein